MTLAEVRKEIRDYNKKKRQGIKIEKVIVRQVIEIAPNYNNGWIREHKTFDDIFNTVSAMKKYVFSNRLKNATMYLSYGYVSEGKVYWTSVISKNAKDVVKYYSDYAEDYNEEELYSPQFH